MEAPPTVAGASATGARDFGGPSPAASTAAAAPPARAGPFALAIGYGAIALGAGVAVGLWALRHPPGFVPASGISVFAPLYILAQGIERFLEPLSGRVKAPVPTSTATPGQKPANTTKPDSVMKVSEALVAGDVQTAASWQAVVDTGRTNAAVIMWGVASFIGMALCGLLGIYMLRSVGFVGVPKWIDVVLSGLAVGSGTKPLHDFISNLQASSASKQDPPEKQSS